MDNFLEDLKVIRESQIRMEADLKYHIKRTDHLEHVQKDMIREQRELAKQISEARKPVSINQILQAGAWLATLSSAIYLIFFKDK